MNETEIRTETCKPPAAGARGRDGILPIICILRHRKDAPILWKVRLF